MPKLTIFAHSLALYCLEANLVKKNIMIAGQFFFLTNMIISVWPSLPTFLHSDDSLSPLCNIIGFGPVKHAFISPGITGIVPLKNVEEPHIAMGVRHIHIHRVFL